MEHDERLNVAEELASRLLEKYGKEILLAGAAKTTYFVYRGMAASITVVTKSEVIKTLTVPCRQWEMFMGGLSHVRVFAGDEALRTEWMDMGLSPSPEKFNRAIEELWPESVTESHGRIHSCRYRDDYSSLHLSVVEVLYEMKDIICLLNRRWVSHDYYDRLADTFDFKILREGWKKAVPVLWESRDIDEIISIIDPLVDNFNAMLVENGIELRDYRHIDEIPV